MFSIVFVWALLGSLNLKTGDLVFTDLDCGKLCEAIEDVTLDQFGVSGPRLSHVAAIEKLGDKVYVIEAWAEGGVQRISWEDYNQRSQKHWFGRIRDPYRQLAIDAVEKMKARIGKPYDPAFFFGNDSYYCSELVFESWAPGEHWPFRPTPMFFGSEGSTAYQTWSEYYSKQGLSVPTGEPGLSPLGIYLAGKQRLFK